VKQSDVIFYNFTPGASMEKEIKYDRLNEVNASIFVSVVSGYGQCPLDLSQTLYNFCLHVLFHLYSSKLKVLYISTLNIFALDIVPEEPKRFGIRFGHMSC
jgi:hypothetical protein